jgi:hypothetical protein
VNRGGRLAALDLLRERQRRVDRDGVGVGGRLRLTAEAEAVADRARGVDADHLARAVQQGAAGVAGLDRRVRLDQVPEPLAAALIVAHRDRPPQARDRPADGGEAPGAACVPDRLDRGSRGELRRAAGRDRRETGGALELQDGDVGRNVVADDVCGCRSGRSAAPSP